VTATVKLIFCPKCLAWSRDPGDIERGYCGACRRATGGRAFEVDADADGGYLTGALRAQALYAIEIYTPQALVCGATMEDVRQATERGEANHRLLRAIGPRSEEAVTASTPARVRRPG
jgi:hypothetical protein